jgi:hypothetical protein
MESIKHKTWNLIWSQTSNKIWNNANGHVCNVIWYSMSILINDQLSTPIVVHISDQIKENSNKIS